MQEENDEINNNNFNNFLELNQIDNPLDSSFSNYDLLDEKSEDTEEEKEYMRKNIEQNGIKRSSSDLINFVLLKVH